MKTSLSKYLLFGLLLLHIIFFIGWYAYSDEGGILHIIKNANKPFNNLKIAQTPHTLQINAIQVKRKNQGDIFWTESRKDKIERYRCTQCHNNTEVKVPYAAEIAHGDIVLDHGGQEKTLDCFTCHKKDDRDFLVTEGGIKVEMDHSYQTCGQCHFRQKKDWVGGAHGKRIASWAGKRIIKNCTSCHDPHSPHFKKQWPKTYSPPLTK